MSSGARCSNPFVYYSGLLGTFYASSKYLGPALALNISPSRGRLLAKAILGGTVLLRSGMVGVGVERRNWCHRAVMPGIPLAYHINENN